LPSVQSCECSPRRRRECLKEDGGRVFTFRPLVAVISHHTLRDADTDDELLRDCVHDGREYLCGVPDTFFWVAAVFVIAAVQRRREKFVEQVTVRAVQFHAVEAGLVGVPGRRDEPFLCRFQVPLTRSLRR